MGGSGSIVPRKLSSGGVSHICAMPTAALSPFATPFVIAKDATPMFTTPAFAQSAGGSPMDTFPLVMLMVLGIVFFLVIRPQQQKAKEFAAMIDKVRRGDTVVTAGGFVARVSKVDEGSDEIEVQLTDTMKVRVLKSTLLSVRSKNEPVKETT
jgi:preprotein translocase subunit YajC